ncbi:MAG: hypothetical protein AAFU03_10595, partial [Bacteroidota bacterium]
VNIPFDVILPAGDLLNRLEAILNGGAQGQILAPLRVSGHVMLTNGQSVPVSAEVKFFTL